MYGGFTWLCEALHHKHMALVNGQTALARDIVRKSASPPLLHDAYPIAVYRIDENGEQYVHWIDAVSMRGDK
jgi:hypothetical protein